MKKFLAMLLCLVMVLSLMACGAKEETAEPDQGTDVTEDTAGENADEIVGMANPWVDYDSLEEINNEVGCNLCKPAAMGVSGEHFSVGDMGEYKMAQYQFSIGGYDYNFRCAPTAEDISGIWDEYVQEALAQPGNGHVELVETDTYKVARWMTIDGQYVLSVMDNGEMELDTFDGIAQELFTLTTTDMVNENGENG